ncbi:MAG: ferredoxin [Pseudomonadota bacterium]
MTPTDLETVLRPHHLGIFGAFHPTPGDGLADDIKTLVLLGPEEPGFWAHFTSSLEWTEKRKDPIDDWSYRVISGIAAALKAEAFFPFGGPPHQPFVTWALRTGRCWQSPVSILVHDTAGLMVSFRGALGLRERLDIPVPPTAPCERCTKPCLTACPAEALTGNGYDVPACHAFLNTEAGRDNLTQGCAVRRACPVSQTYGRLPEQSAFHMSKFHR